LPRCQGKFERDVRARGFRHVAGVDEVGRGCIFGPVVAAAVILSPERPIRGLRDSKMLSPEDREILAVRIKQRAVCWAVGAADAYEIDRINIYQASRVAMKRAVEKLTPLPDFLLVDAIQVDLPIEQEAMIQGDGRSQCIAAASIVAKTHRDEMMRKWDEVFPFLGLVRHKGYGTEEHLDAIRQHGPTLLHRFSFEPVRAACQYELWTGYDQIEVAVEAGA
jgi:ribonuclease HII